jgi:cytochrome c-type protein NapC
MQDYGKSLMVDDAGTSRPSTTRTTMCRDKACFTCHTDYTMFGTAHAKLRGLRHVYIQYLGKIPAPADIKLYTPFNNRECLHCHGESRKFLTNSAHTEEDTTMASMKAGRLSCLASGCHDVAHDVHNLAGAPIWKEPRR